MVVVFINVGLSAGFPTARAGLHSTMVSVPCLLETHNLFQEFLSYNKQEKKDKQPHHAR